MAGGRMLDERGRRTYYRSIREGVDLGALARELLGQPTGGTATRLHFDCPRHRSQSHHSFHVDLHAGLWHCFGCGVGGDAIQLVEFVRFGAVTAGRHGPMADTHRAARDELAARVGLPPLSKSGLSEVDAAKIESEAAERDAVFAALEDAARWFHAELGKRQDVREWVFKQWGIGEEACRRLTVGFADEGLWGALAARGHAEDVVRSTGLFRLGPHDEPRSAFFDRRVVFPYWVGGRVVYMIGRKTPWTPDKAWEQGKYVKLPVRDDGSHRHISRHVRNDVLWGEDVIGTRPDRVVVTEGITDAIAAQEAGVPTISPATVKFAQDVVGRIGRRLKGRVKEVVLVQDNELSGVGEQGALATARLLEEFGLRTTIATLPLRQQHVDARTRWAELLGPDAAAKVMALPPTRRAAAVSEALKGDPAKVAEADRLEAAAKIDVCEWFKDGGTAEAFAELLAAAREPIEVLIDRVPRFDDPVEAAKACEGILAEVGRMRASARDKYLRRLKDRTGVAKATLKSEASDLGRKAAAAERDERKKKDEAPPAPGSLVELIEEAKRLAADAQDGVDWGAVAAAGYSWFLGSGGRFFKTRAGEPLLFWKDQLYEMRSRDVGPRALWDGLVWRLARLSQQDYAGKKFCSVLSSLAADEGKVVDVWPWIHTDFRRHRIHVHLGGDEHNLAVLSPDGVQVVPNGANEDGVILRGDEKFLPVRYEEGLDGAALDDEVRRLVTSRMACPNEQAAVLVAWASAVFLLEFAGTRPMVRCEGKPSSGKSWAAKLLTTLIYGQQQQKRATIASNWEDASRNPLLALDNVESADADPDMVAFLLTSATGITRERRAPGSGGVVVQRPTCLLLTTGVEPLAGELQEVNSRSLVVEFDEDLQTDGVYEQAALSELQEARGRILSGLLRRSAAVLRMMAGGAHVRAIAALRSAFGPAHDRRRCDEFLALMYLHRVAAAPEEDRESMLTRADPAFVDGVISATAGSRDTARDASPVGLAVEALFGLLEKDSEFRSETQLTYHGGTISDATPQQLFVALSEACKRRGVRWEYRNVVQFGKRLAIAQGTLAEQGFRAVAVVDRRSRRWTISRSPEAAGLLAAAAAPKNGSGGASAHAGGDGLDDIQF